MSGEPKEIRVVTVENEIDMLSEAIACAGKLDAALNEICDADQKMYTRAIQYLSDRFIFIQNF